MSDDHLTKQDEDISAPEFDAEENLERYAFGNWPELFGLILTAVLIWLTIALTG